MDDEEIVKGDKLVLRGMKFHGFHGVKPEEKKLGQKFLVAVDAWLDLRAAGISDKFSDSVSYTQIYRITKEVMEGPSHDLLESVANLIAATTLDKFPQVSAIRVKVQKPHVAVVGSLDSLGIEIFRSRKNDSNLVEAEIPRGDKLVLRGLKFHGYHGVKSEEKKLGQKFLVDVDAWVDLRTAGKSDCLSDTISYTEIYRIAKAVLEGQSQNLLEALSHRIAMTTLTKFSQISAVRVKVGKPHVAVHGSVDYLGIEIFRSREIDCISI